VNLQRVAVNDGRLPGQVICMHRRDATEEKQRDTDYSHHDRLHLLCKIDGSVVPYLHDLTIEQNRNILARRL
jgi:hypothetical protein